MSTASDDYLRAYQESGLSYITIFIAFIFGLFSILPFMKDVAKYGICYFIMVSIIYWLLWLGGLYCLGKFFLYLELRDYVITIKNKQKPQRPYRDSYIKDSWKNSKSNYRKRLSSLADFILTGGSFNRNINKIVCIISFYFLMVIIPYIVILLISFPIYIMWVQIILVWLFIIYISIVAKLFSIKNHTISFFQKKIFQLRRMLKYNSQKFRT